ncbi:MAG: SRPBCC domain-containing protein [Caulobacteraceae bacterium]
MRVKLEHRLGIPAPAEAIWEVIADISGWPAWNPLYPRAEGVLRIGAPLVLEVALPDQKPRLIRPIVSDWVPNEQILWKLSMFGGLIKSTRYLEIEQLTEAGCIFSNGEMFDGPLGPMIAHRMRPAIRAGFAAMGEAVKARTLATWRPANLTPN